jgi:hypothetical protein
MSTPQATPNGVSFNLTLKRLPFFVDEKARKMLPYLTFEEELNDVRIAFKGLRPGSYYLKLSDKLGEMRTKAYDREELERGIELSTLWDAPPMRQAARVAGITKQKNDLHRYFWRVLALPDNYDVNAPYDPKPHRLGIHLAREIERYRNGEVEPHPMKVEVVPADATSATPPASTHTGDTR